MSGEVDGIVCLRGEVLYVESSRVHLVGDREHAVTHADRILLDLVQSGEGDLRRLGAALQRVVGAVDEPILALHRAVTDPRSILELVPHHGVIRPDVVVCCFGDGPCSRWAGALVRRLRRSRRVLFLGSDDAVRGPIEQNVSFKASRAKRQHDNWYQYVQWVRGTLRRFEGSALVLCGPVDAILFGDLVPYFRTVTVVDTSWPAHVGLSDIVGPDWVPPTLIDERRELYYALRFGGQEALDKLSRLSGSAFAVLEAHALRYSEVVAVTSTDHEAELLRLGVDPGAIVPAHPLAASSRGRVAARPEAPDVLVVVCGVELGFEPVVPYLQLLESIPAASRVHAIVALRVDDGWLRWNVDGATASIVRWAGPPPGPERILATIVLVGLMRDLSPAWTALAGSAPCRLVPSRRPHPIQRLAPAELLLSHSSATRIAEYLREVADPASHARARALAVQRRFVRALDLAAIAAQLADGLAVDSPSPA